MKIFDDLYAYIWTSFSQNNCNTYLVGPSGKMFIDPGHLHLFDHVVQGMEADGLDQQNAGLVVATHSHPDHFEGVEFFFDDPQVKIAVHPTEEEFLEQTGRDFARMMGLSMPKYRVDVYLDEGELEVDGLKFQVYHTPGHSPGHICLYWAERKVLFSGDLIFNQGVGRTDFPGGDGRLLKESINRMAELEIEMILSGHGEAILGQEAVRRNFQFIKEAYFGLI